MTCGCGICGGDAPAPDAWFAEGAYFCLPCAESVLARGREDDWCKEWRLGRWMEERPVAAEALVNCLANPDD